MENNLKNIEKFFLYNLKIKEILYKLQPNDMYSSIEDTINYVDKLYEGLEDIKFYIKEIVKMYYETEQNYINDYFKILEGKLIEAGSNFDKLKAYYQACFSDMSEEIINEVGNKCAGYSIDSVSIKQATTINELLHIIHQSIINNENILETMPIMGKKVNINKEEIMLYGKENEISSEIYNKFPLDMDCGRTDILSLEDRIIIMSRDLGHALSIEIERENDKYYVKYFIPKICNINMINNLKGVNKVDDSSKYTIGEFQADKETLANDLFHFMDMVPRDQDMWKEGGPYYNEEKQR